MLWKGSLPICLRRTTFRIQSKSSISHPPHTHTHSNSSFYPSTCTFIHCLWRFSSNFYIDLQHPWAGCMSLTPGLVCRNWSGKWTILIGHLCLQGPIWISSTTPFPAQSRFIALSPWTNRVTHLRFTRNWRVVIQLKPAIGSVPEHGHSVPVSQLNFVLTCDYRNSSTTVEPETKRW